MPDCVTGFMQRSIKYREGVFAMLPARRFWSNITSAFMVVGFEFLFMGLFLVGYMPTFAKQAIDQQITIVASLITATVFFAAQIAMIVASVIYERPGAQQESE